MRIELRTEKAVDTRGVGEAIAPLLAKAIGYTHSDQSVSSLFD